MISRPTAPTPCAGACWPCPRPRTSASAEDKIAQGLQLTNKLWNAARLILLGVGPGRARRRVSPRTVEDRWILSRLERAEAEVAARIERYDFSHAALELYDFVYGELCDWYLELVKPRLRAGEPELSATLLHVLTQTLALAHPMIPFVTEEIYRYVPGAEGLLAAGVPERRPAPSTSAAEARVERVIEAIQALRGLARLRRRQGRRRRVPARLRRRLRGDRRAPGAPGPRVVDCRAGRRRSRSRRVPVPGGAVEILASDELDLEARRAQA